MIASEVWAGVGADAGRGGVASLMAASRVEWVGNPPADAVVHDAEAAPARTGRGSGPPIVPAPQARRKGRPPAPNPVAGGDGRGAGAEVVRRRGEEAAEGRPGEGAQDAKRDSGKFATNQRPRQSPRPSRQGSGCQRQVDTTPRRAQGEGRGPRRPAAPSPAGAPRDPSRVPESGRFKRRAAADRNDRGRPPRREAGPVLRRTLRLSRKFTRAPRQ